MDGGTLRINLSCPFWSVINHSDAKMVPYTVERISTVTCLIEIICSLTKAQQ